MAWQGWLVLLVASVLFAGFSLVTVHPFLATIHRVDTNILVVEGWVHDYAIQAGIDEYRTGSYERIFVTGGPVTGSGPYTSDYDTSAHVGESRLKALGMPAEAIQAVPSRVVDRERTYYAALALRDWFHQQAIEVHAINIVTENVHARRTRLLFAEAFGPKVAVGVIAAFNPDYNPKRWWRYSEGVREVIGEAIAYIYAKFFFYPPAASGQEQ